MFTNKLTLKIGIGAETTEEVRAAMMKKIGKGPFYYVKGLVNGYEVTTGSYGEIIRFNGQFSGVDLETGEIIDSMTAYFPKSFSQQLKTQFDNESKGENFEFTAFECQVSVNAHPTQGYSYVVHAPITKEFIDARAQLSAAVKAQKALLSSKEVQQLL